MSSKLPRTVCSRNGQCLADGCLKLAAVGGLCRTHYSRAQHNPTGADNRGKGRALTDEQAEEARRMLYREFRSRREVAAHFGVSTTTITKAINRVRGES